MEGDIDMMCVTNTEVTSPHTYHMKAKCVEFFSDWKKPINPKYNMNSKF